MLQMNTSSPPSSTSPPWIPYLKQEYYSLAPLNLLLAFCILLQNSLVVADYLPDRARYAAT